MKVTSRFIPMRTIELDNGFMADIILDTKQDCYETWLFHPDFSAKMFMYGLPIHNRRFEQSITITLDSIIDDIEFHADESLQEYIEAHMLIEFISDHAKKLSNYTRFDDPMENLRDYIKSDLMDRPTLSQIADYVNSVYDDGMVFPMSEFDDLNTNYPVSTNCFNENDECIVIVNGQLESQREWAIHERYDDEVKDYLITNSDVSAIVKTILDHADEIIAEA